MKFGKIPPTITLIRHTGLIVGFKTEEYRLVGSPDNIRKVLEDINHKNLIYGWWSPLSIFVNPSVMLGNYLLLSQYESRYDRFYKNDTNTPTEVRTAEQSTSTGITAGLFKYIIPTALFLLQLLYSLSQHSSLRLSDLSRHLYH